MNKYLFVVESPFQLLSALEARNYFKKAYSVLILKYSGSSDQKNDFQLRKIIDEFNNFDEIIEIQPFSGIREANYRLLFILKMLQIKKIVFSKIFIGAYRSWYHRIFWDILAPKEKYVLDDGNITIELQKRYLPTGKYYDLSKGFKKGLKQVSFKLISLFFYTGKNDFHKNFHLFTCFDLAPYNKIQKVIKNKFSFIKNNSKKKYVDESKICFFGGNLSDLNLLSRDLELSLLEIVINYYKSKNKELVYIPHRREMVEKLELIRNKFNIDFITFSYPAEIEFLLMETHPYGIASFVSTALFTVSKMFDFGSVEAFYLPMDAIAEAYRQDIISVYDEYRKTMKVIDLNELS